LYRISSCCNRGIETENGKQIVGVFRKKCKGKRDAQDMKTGGREMRKAVGRQVRKEVGREVIGKWGREIRTEVEWEIVKQ
jgi:hypothetical protein